MTAMRKNFCEDCGLSCFYHLQSWLDELAETFLPSWSLSKKHGAAIDTLLEKFFGAVRLIKLEEDFALSEVPMRSACFIKEARKRGVRFRAIRGPFGYTNHFCAEANGKKIRFDSLPTADFAGEYSASFVDNKERARKHLVKGNFPVPEGRSFWFFEKGRATRYGVNHLGFPLVVKPRSGSVARHVAIDLNNIDDLSQAIDRAIVFSPVFIVERFIADSFVHRATVVDFDNVFCARQAPVNVVGDGVSSIYELVHKKNEDQRRGDAHAKGFFLHKLVLDSATEELLVEKNYTLSSVPMRGEIVYLQKKPFLKLGGDLEEVTSQVHPDNLKLFRDIAIFFDIRLVGIDFIAPDISRSWKDQFCAVLELNSVPCIEMHHFPSHGTPQNAASAVVDLFFKYYL